MNLSWQRKEKKWGKNYNLRPINYEKNKNWWQGFSEVMVNGFRLPKSTTKIIKYFEDFWAKTGDGPLNGPYILVTIFLNTYGILPTEAATFFCGLGSHLMTNYKELYNFAQLYKARSGHHYDCFIRSISYRTIHITI